MVKPDKNRKKYNFWLVLNICVLSVNAILLLFSWFFVYIGDPENLGNIIRSDIIMVIFFYSVFIIIQIICFIFYKLNS